MANSYAANFGDVVKHAVLCEVVAQERPARYVESHGGRLRYDLAGLDPGPGGVWDFLAFATGVDELDGSVYARRLRREAGTPAAPGTYPGSIALASSVLRPDAEVLAFELVDASAADLEQGLAALGRRARVEVADGLVGACAQARPGDLVLLDPFDVHARGDGPSAAEAFATLAAAGIPTMLWYAIYSPDETDDWIASAAVVGAWSARLAGHTSVGGLAGCGFLTAHLSPSSERAASSMVAALADALADTRPGLRVI